MHTVLCSFTKCNEIATCKYAGANVCEEHYNLVMEETKRYYSKKIPDWKREYFYEIYSCTLWYKVETYKNNKKEWW